MTTSSRSRYRIPMLDRSLHVLELLAAAASGLSIAELCRELAAPKSSVFNILATLEERGYVRHANGAGKYVLTTRLYRLGSALVAQLDVKRVLDPLLLELVDQTGETANLGILDGVEAIYIESIEGHSRVRVAVTPGERIELHCTALGKALLANLPPDKVTAMQKGRRLRAHTPQTVTTVSALNHQLALIREQGYAFDDEEDNPDIRCLGAPI